MDVGGASSDSVLHEEIDEAHHRRLEGHIAQMADVLVHVLCPVLVHALHDPLQRRGNTLIGTIDGVGNGVGEADHQLHRQSRELPQIVGDERIQRIGSGQGEQAAVHAHRADGILAQVLRRDAPSEWVAATGVRRG